jgi:hypothetical protein
MIISAPSDYRKAAERRLPRFLFDYVDGVWGRAIAYGSLRRLDRSAKRGAERPSLHDKRLVVEGRSLHSALRASVETTGVALCDSPPR